VPSTCGWYEGIKWCVAYPNGCDRARTLMLTVLAFSRARCAWAMAVAWTLATLSRARCARATADCWARSTFSRASRRMLLLPVEALRGAAAATGGSAGRATSLTPAPVLTTTAMGPSLLQAIGTRV